MERLGERDALIAGLREAAQQLPGVQSSWVAAVSGPVLNAGHIVWRMTFGAERDALAAPLAPAWSATVAPLLAQALVTAVGYHVTRSAAREAGPGLWRALIFRVTPEGFPTTAKELEQNLLLFPKYIRSIRSWALSRVSATEGPKSFTHVWEQEFDSLHGFTGEYMQHPIHWGLVDAYFDAEYPQYVVDPHLVQVVAEIDEAVLSVHAVSSEDSNR
jgi:hypothetical protein